MANDDLKNPVLVQASRIDATALPAGLSQVFQQYLIQQGADFGSVAGKANEAGLGAYEAQVKNDEQDITLAGHEQRITANTRAISLLEIRVTTAEGQIVVLRSDVDYLLDEVVDIQAHIVTIDLQLEGLSKDVADIKTDYVSKKETSTQAMKSPLDVQTSYSVGGVKVVGERQTGFTPATGSAYKGPFNANTEMPVGESYSQSQLQTIANNTAAALQRIKAHEDALRAHGLID